MSPVEEELRSFEPLASLLVEALHAITDGEDELTMLDRLARRASAHFDADGVGVLLASPDGVLDIAATTGTDTRVLELMQLRTSDGPCVHAHETGESVLADVPGDTAGRWPSWTAEAVHRGYGSIMSAPLRHSGDGLGAINALARRPAAFTARDVAALEAIADVATIVIAEERRKKELSVLAAQLSEALKSRVLIEQAKGVVSAQRGVRPDDAFLVIRGYCRSHNLRLRDVVQRIVDGDLAL